MFKYIILLVTLIIIMLTLYNYQKNEINKDNSHIGSQMNMHPDSKKSTIISHPDREKSIVTRHNISYPSKLSEKDEWDAREVNILTRHKAKKWKKILIEEPDIEEDEEHGINKTPSLSDKELEELEEEIILSLKFKHREDKKYEMDSNLD